MNWLLFYIFKFLHIRVFSRTNFSKKEANVLEAINKFLTINIPTKYTQHIYITLWAGEGQNVLPVHNRATIALWAFGLTGAYTNLISTRILDHLTYTLPTISIRVFDIWIANNRDRATNF